MKHHRDAEHDARKAFKRMLLRSYRGKVDLHKAPDVSWAMVQAPHDGGEGREHRGPAHVG